MTNKQKRILYPLATIAFLILIYGFLTSVVQSIKDLGESIIIIPASEFGVIGHSIPHVALESLPVTAQINRIFKSDAKVATAIFKAESGLNCKAVSKTNDHGVAQLHGKPIYDCTQNLLEAKRMFDRRGFQPWVAYNTKAYLRYLD